MGQGLLCLGTGTILTGLVNCILQTQNGWAFFLAGGAAFFLLANKAQKTYNGSWFS